MTDTLLPANAGPLERALEAATARLGAVPLTLGGALSDPATCPADLLPWLAWAARVDAWSPDWTEAQKRAAIAASAYVHSRKGTRGAVERALAAVGYPTRLQERRDDPSLDPFTFRIEVLFDGREIGPETYAEIGRLVAAAKNARSHLAVIRNSNAVHGPALLALVPRGGLAGMVRPPVAPDVSLAAPLRLGAATAASVSGRLWPYRPDRLRADVPLRLAATVALCIRGIVRPLPPVWRADSAAVTADTTLRTADGGRRPPPAVPVGWRSADSALWNASTTLLTADGVPRNAGLTADSQRIYADSTGWTADHSSA